MAIHNALEQAPEILRAYLLACGMNETEEGVIRISETLTPLIDIWNGRPEWALLRGETPWGFSQNVAAGAATTWAGVGVINPTGSGIVTVVQKAKLQNAAVTDVGVMYVGTAAAIAAAFPTSRQVNTRDRRLSTVGQTLIQSGNTQVGAFAGTEMEYSASPDTICEFIHLPIMLYAGQGLLVQTNNDAAAIEASMSGYERKCVLNEARGGR